MISAASPLHLVPGRRKTRRGVLATAAAVLATALVLAPGSVSPAMADGLTLNLVPRGDAAELLRHGLAIYQMICEQRNHARTDQRGAGNGAAISQSGHGNAALVLQRGKENSGTSRRSATIMVLPCCSSAAGTGRRSCSRATANSGSQSRAPGRRAAKAAGSRRAASLRLLTAAFGPGCAKTRSAMVIRDLGGDLAGRRGQVGKIHPCGRLMVS